MQTIPFDHFVAVELRAGTVTRAEEFPEARKPAFKLWVDFGPEIGVKQTSAQIAAHYTPDKLVGRQVVGCLNLGEKKIAGFASQFLCTGFPDEAGAVVLISPDKPVPNGAKLF
ncbi:MAG TPA: tRNA-binding protein [Alphaproteobacteria bacterium]|nr:tRNA-binding protein [Alphaproteobacteria bacterium]